MRTATAAAAASAAALLLAGCGSHGSVSAARQAGATGASAPTVAGGGGAAGNGARASAVHGPRHTSAKPTAGAATCQTLALSVTLDDAQAGGAAGSAYLPLNFGNESGRPCALRGYPGVSFVAGASGTQVGQAAIRDPGYPVGAVTLAPGASAHAWLRVAAAQNYPLSACGQLSARGLRVYPPGNTAAAYVPHAFAACRSATMSILAVLPVRAGRGMRGALP